MHGFSDEQSGRSANNEKRVEEKHNNVAGTGVDNASSGGNEFLLEKNIQLRSPPKVASASLASHVATCSLHWAKRLVSSLAAVVSG